MLPLTVITGAFGMNVTVPFQTNAAEHDPDAIAFYGILAGMVGIGGVLLLLFKKYDFL